MKKLSYVSLTVVLFLLVSIAANATGSRAEFKAFEISPVEDLFMGKKVDKIWTLSYSGDEVPVTVVKRKTLEGTEYVVHSKYFEVSYLAVNGGIG